MTTNLLHGGADMASFREALTAHDPDVVVTQELGFDCAELLAGRYPSHYLHPSEDFTGRGIATRLEAEFGDIAMPTRWGTTASLVVEGVVWRLAGVHLLNPIEFPWWATAGSRRGQLAAVEEWADDLEAGPALLAGDFNASPVWPAYRRLVRDGWTDLVADHAAGSGNPSDATWGWRPGWPRVLRIDHVFGRGVAASDVAVVPIKGSDHAAVVVDIALHARTDRLPGSY